MFGLNEALMSFIRRQVGLRTDAGDPNGSLHAKARDIKNTILPGVMVRQITASDTCQFYIASRITYGAYEKVFSKRFLVWGVIRIKFQYNNPYTNGAFKIYKNGIEIAGAEGTSAMQTFSGDFAVDTGDYISLEAESLKLDDIEVCYSLVDLPVVMR